VGSNKSSASHWKAGDERPEAEAVVKIADLFGYDRYELLQLARYVPGEPPPQPDPYRLVKYRQLDAWLTAVGAAYEAFFWQALTIQAEFITELIRSVSHAGVGFQQPAEPAISTSESETLACTCLFCRPGASGPEGGPGDTLAILLALPLAG